MSDSTSIKILGFLTIFFFVGLALIYYGLRRYLLMQKISNTPTSKVEAAAIGLIELYGRAEASPPLSSPISSEKCAYWNIVIEYYYSGKDSGWRRLCNIDSNSKFFLMDETGKILVDPKGAELSVNYKKLDEGYLSGTGVWGMQHAKLSDNAIAFINSLDPLMKGRVMGFAHENMRVLEHYIGEDDQVFVFGTAEPLENAASTVQSEDLIVRKGNDKILMISESNEKAIVTNMKWSVFLCTLGGLALSAICLFIILIAYLHLW